MTLVSTSSIRRGDTPHQKRVSRCGEEKITAKHLEAGRVLRSKGRVSKAVRVVAERFRRSPGTPIRVVDRIAFDYLHVVVRESLGAESIGDQTGRRIWVGEEGSAFVVRQLHHDVLRKSNRTSPIVVLADAETPYLKQLSHFGDGREEAFDEVYSCFGDPTDEAALKRANAKKARAVIILSDGEHSDERTIRSILALQEIARADPASSLHVVAELIDPANAVVLKHLDAGFPGRVEAVSGPRLRTCLLSQAALTEGITTVYTDLLSVDPGTNEIYAEPIRQRLTG